MKNSIILSILVLFILTVSCNQKNTKQTFLVKNELDLDRENETLELTRADLDLEENTSLDQVFIKDIENGNYLITQTVDLNNDGHSDIILFQPKLKPLEEKQFQIAFNVEKEIDTTAYCYSRFVPERTDDYAWENDKVAFRTFGPTAQKMVEENIKGGTLTSGIDAWLKKVNYPIINKWYKKTVSGKGSYHEDTGEGLDNFHVGVSRGIGGIAIKQDSIYHVSKNFTSWKTITTGPIRTSFILTYENWDANDKIIKEEKLISLDFGNNLSKFEISISGNDSIAAGLTLHEKDGQINTNLKKGWVSYWEPHEGSALGTAIVAPNQTLSSYDHYISSKKDESNLYANIKVQNQKAIYYAGFGWKESGQFKSKEEWEAYLNLFAEKLNSPLQIIKQ